MIGFVLHLGPASIDYVDFCLSLFSQCMNQVLSFSAVLSSKLSLFVLSS